MFEFDNNHIFTGYIKELLASFDFPKYQIYTQEMAQLKRRYGVEPPNVMPTIHFSKEDLKSDSATQKTHSYYFPYYKDGEIQWYYGTEQNTNSQKSVYKYNWVTEVDRSGTSANALSTLDHEYYIGKRDLNSTKRYLIRNNSYDSYTHKYLGEYLRYKRDFEGLNLMPLYNCFSNEICLYANFKFRPYVPNSVTIPPKVNISTSEPGYKLYMVPVKLFQKYTIAIDSECGAELVCGFYDKRQIVESTLANPLMNGNEVVTPSLYQVTYKKYNSLKFNHPVVYDKLANREVKSNTDNQSITLINDAYNAIRYASDELFTAYNYLAILDKLYLFIKVPLSCNSTVVVLEGDYSGYNNITWTVVKPYGTQLLRTQNHTVTNYDIFRENSDIRVKFDSYADQTPFNPITNLQLLELNTGKQHPFSDRLLEYLLENVITSSETEIPDNIQRVQETIRYNVGLEDLGPNGIWIEKIRRIMYDYMQVPHRDCPSGLNYYAMRDCLGYVDKDVEHYYTGWKTDSEGEEASAITTISNIDIYTE